MMENRLIIIGAGGFGREILAWAEDIRSQCLKLQTPIPWTIGGFLDGNSEALKPFDIGLPVLGSPDTWQPGPHDRFVCAIGDPVVRLRLCRSLLERGAVFETLIHPTAMIGARCRIGIGSILCPWSVVTVDAVLGQFVTLNIRATVGHDVVIGDGCTLNSFCDITGGAWLGEGVFLGSHAVVLPRTRIGDWSKVGAGSVVVKNTKAGASVLGVPARRIDLPQQVLRAA